ncbi:response regulator [bacterium]|nr:response regulator [bacterium]
MSLKEKIEESLESKINIIVVDDEPKILKALQRVLGGLPYNVDYYDGPLKVLEGIGDKEISLVVSDNMMPEMSGLDLLAKINEKHPICQKYLLTGATASQQAIDAFNKGTINQFIPKPWDNNQLIDIINEGISKYKKEKAEQIRGQLKDHVLLKQSEQFEKAKQALKQTQTELELKKSLDNIDKINVPAELKQLAILIIGHNKNISNAILEALKKIGFYQCEAVNTIERAMEILIRSSWVNVILSDGDFIDGLKLYKTIQSQSGIHPKPSYILITTKSQKDEIEQAIQSKIDGYIIKPFRLETLLDQLSNVADKLGFFLDRSQKSKKEKNSFLIAGKDFNVCNTISNHLILGGIEKVSITHSGRAVFHILKAKRIDVLFYHDDLDDPHWHNLVRSLRAENIDYSDMKVVITSHSGIKAEEQVAHNFDSPVSFLNRRFDKSAIFVALNQILNGNKLADFNYRK